MQRDSVLSRCFDRNQQFFTPERLAQKAGRSLPDRLFPVAIRRLSGDEDYGGAIVLSGQPALQFETRDAGQIDIDDQADSPFR